MNPWNDSPRIGLNALSMSKQSTLFVNAKATQFLKRSTGLAAFLSMRSGATERDSHNLWMLESLLKISTGSEMLRKPLPENRFFLRVLMMNLMTLFCAAAFTSFASFIPPPLSITKSFLSIRFAKGFFLRHPSSLIGAMACLTFTYLLGRMTRPSALSSMTSEVQEICISLAFSSLSCSCLSSSSVISQVGRGLSSSAMEQKSSSSLLAIDMEERGCSNTLEATDRRESPKELRTCTCSSVGEISQFRSQGFLKSPLKRVMQLSRATNSRRYLRVSSEWTCPCSWSSPPWSMLSSMSRRDSFSLNCSTLVTQQLMVPLRMEVKGMKCEFSMEVSRKQEASPTLQRCLRKRKSRSLQTLLQARCLRQTRQALSEEMDSFTLLSLMLSFHSLQFCTSQRCLTTSSSRCLMYSSIRNCDFLTRCWKMQSRCASSRTTGRQSLKFSISSRLSVGRMILATFLRKCRRVDFEVRLESSSSFSSMRSQISSSMLSSLVWKTSWMTDLSSGSVSKCGSGERLTLLSTSRLVTLFLVGEPASEPSLGCLESLTLGLGGESTLLRLQMYLRQLRLFSLTRAASFDCEQAAISKRMACGSCCARLSKMKTWLLFLLRRRRQLAREISQWAQSMRKAGSLSLQLGPIFNPLSTRIGKIQNSTSFSVKN